MTLKLSALPTNTTPASGDYFVMAKALAAGDVIVKLSDLMANLPSGSVGSTALAPVHVQVATGALTSTGTWNDIASTSSTFTVPTNGTVGLVFYSISGQFNTAPPAVAVGGRLLMDTTTVVAETRLDVGVTGATATMPYLGSYTFTAGSHTTKLQQRISAGNFDLYSCNYLILFLNA